MAANDDDDETVCLSKLLLDAVGDPLSGRDLYKLYFESFALADADSNLSCLKSRPNQVDKVLNSMYKIRHPSQEPTFFSVNSFHDLCRLSTLLHKELVIYWAADAGCTVVNIFHDFRILSRPATEELLFLITTDKQVHKYKRAESKLRIDVSYFSAKTVAFERNWSFTVGQLLDFPADELTGGLVQNVPADLQENRQALYEAWGRPVLFVALCKTKLSTVSNKWLRQKPGNSHFVTVALVGPPVSQMSLETLQNLESVVCFVGGGPNKQVCLLKDAFKKRVIAELIRTTHKDKLLNRDFLQLPKVSRETRESAAATLQAKKKKFVTRAEQKGRKCVCEICSEPAYTSNMSKVGPEKLITYSPDVTELLRFLGLDSESNVRAVEQLCEWSVASMDIESTTVPLDLASPVNPDTGVQHSVIDRLILEGHLQKIQKPLMIAHLDSLMPDQEPKVFVVESDSEEAIYAMMRDYWAFVSHRHRTCTEAKKHLVEPILAVIRDYKLKHNQFHLDWWQDDQHKMGEDEKPDIAGTWRNSIPGKLEAALNKLIANYVIFSFYG